MPHDPAAESAFRDLLRLAQTGDHDAFAELTHPFRDELMRHARTKMDRELLTVMSAEDAVQDTLWKACRKLHRGVFESQEKLRVWLLKVLENELLDLRKKHFARCRHPRHGVGSLDAETGETQSGREVTRAQMVPGPEPTPSSLVSNAEQQGKLEQVLTHLPKETALVLRMTMRGMTSVQIAEELGKTPEAIRQMIVRGLDLCREVAARLGIRD